MRLLGSTRHKGSGHLPGITKLAISALFALILAAGSASAATKTWAGPPGTDLWSLPANWGGSLPAPGDLVVFPELGAPRSVNLGTGSRTVNSVQFNAAGLNYYTLDNGTLQINAAVDQAGSAYSQIQCDTAFGPTLALTGAGAGTVYFRGAMNGSPAITVTSGDYAFAARLGGTFGFHPTSLTVSGGHLVLGSTNSWTFTGPINITGGQVCCAAGWGETVSAPVWNVSGSGVLGGKGGAGLPTVVMGPVFCPPAGLTGGTFTPGCSVGTVEINGDLTFGPTGRTEFELAQPDVVGGVNDLVIVDGNLTLDGILDIVGLPGFGAGTYRLYNYGGTLADNGMHLRRVPSGFAAHLDFSIVGQVNLLVSESPILCPADKTVACGTAWDFDPPTIAEGPCGGPGVTITISNTVTNGSPCQMVITREWQVTDLCNNTLSCWQTVTVVDVTPPVITCASDKTVNCGLNCLAPGSVDAAVLKSFAGYDDGSQPFSPLLAASDGRLYGTTYGGSLSGGGTVYGMNPDGSGYVILWSFGLANDGLIPLAGVVEGNDGALYGTTYGGGVHGGGTVYKIQKDGTGYSVLWNFEYNAGPGSVAPYGALIIGSDHALYGTTFYGGNNGQGTVYKLNQDGTGFVVLRRFTGPADGRNPEVGLVAGCGGALFGVTRTGGAYEAGTLFKIKEDGSGYVVLRNFGATTYDPALPSSRLLVGSDGMLYGTTERGGDPYFVGTVYKLNQDGSGFTVLRSFGGSADGVFPRASLVEGCGGTLYGTTAEGGPDGLGTVFQLNKDGSGYAMVWAPNPSGANGRNLAGLTLSLDGGLYVSAAGGGEHAVGAVVRLSTPPAAGTFDPPSAIDDCAGSNVTISVLGTVTNGICPRTITRTWQAVDPCGNGATCSQTLTLLDTTPPSFTRSCDKTVPCGSIWSFDPPSVWDACSGSNVTMTILSTVSNGICGQITRTWLAVDACGNSNICSQVVTVASPPALTCASNKTVECGTSWNFDAPLAHSVCSGGNVTIAEVGTDSQGICPQVITRTWVATDECGNSNTCSQTVTLVDLPPVMVCGSDKTVSCGTPWSFDQPTIFDTCSGSSFSLEVTDTSGSSICPLVITRTWVATDPCGSTNSCSQTVTVMNITPPVLTCAGNKAVLCGSSWNFDPPTTAACGGNNVSISVLRTETNGACPYFVTRTWLATDLCGNTNTCSQTVTVTASPPPDSWTAVQPLADPRWDAAAELLPSGRVLVAGGGVVSSQYLTRADIFQPGINQWLSGVPPLPNAHRHTAVRLLNGQVLVAGDDPSSSAFTAFLYDEATSPSAWLPAGTPHYQHVSATLTRLPSGKVLLAGGYCGGGCATYNTAEIYSPLPVNSWTTTGFMAATRFGHTATLLASGKVLVAGGAQRDPELIRAECELFSETTGTWSAGAAMNQKRFAHTATKLPNGKVLVVGGMTGPNSFDHFTATTEIYDPFLNTWTPAAPMAAPRSHHTATLLACGKLLIAGGQNDSGSLSSCEVYDYVANSWSTTTPMAAARNRHSATLLNTGQVLVAGGWGVAGEGMASSELYTPDCCGVTYVVNTGTDANGGLLSPGSPEQTFFNAGSPPGTGPMVVISPGAIPGVWSPADGRSQWVGPQQDGTGPTGWYTNRWQFSLPCAYATLHSRISTDDEGYLFLNGASIGPVGGFGFGFAMVDYNTGFVPGLNTLEIVVHQGSSATGFRAELEVASRCCAPPGPTNKTVACGDAWAFDAPPIPCSGLADGQLVFTTVTNGLCPQLITRNWVFTNGCSVSNTFSQTVTLVDTTPPLLTCASDKTVVCWAGWSFDPPVVLDACSGTNVTTTVLSTVTNSLCPPVVRRAWLVTDACGNSNSCSQTVTVADQSRFSVNTGTGPGGTLLSPGSPEQTFVNIGSSVGTNQMVVINPLSIPGVWSQPNGRSQWVGPNQNSVGPTGWYTNRWQFTLPCADASLTGRISTDDEGYLFLNGVPIGPPGGFGFGFAAENHSGDFVPGLNTLDIVVHNGGGATGFRAELQVVSQCGFWLPGTTNKTVECGTPWTFDAPVPSSCSGLNTNSTILSTDTYGSCPQAVTRTWGFTNSCGFTNTFSQTVTLVDTTPPALTCASNKTVQCGSTWSFDPPVAQDDCSGASVVVSTLTTVTNGIDPKLITRTWQAVDLCGNVNTCSQTVTALLPPSVKLSVALTASGDLQLSFPTSPGVISVIEYKDAVGDPTWTTLTTLVGNGSVATVVEYKPLLTMRFYRVHHLCP